MRPMLTLAGKNALANRQRFTLTALAVIVSVAFLTATFVLSDSLTGTAEADIASANSTVDLVIRGEEIVTEERGPGEPAAVSRTSLSAGTAESVEAVAGVVDAQAVTAGFAKLVVDGRSLGSSSNADVGTGWITNEALNPFTLASGTAPVGPNQIAIDQATVDRNNLAVGQVVQVLTTQGVAEVEIAGIVTYGSANQAPLQTTTLFDADNAAQLLGQPLSTLVLIETDAGADAAELADTLDRVVDAGSVATGAEYIADEQDAATSPFAFLSVFLVAFAVVATLVGATLIYNTFSIAMAHRRQEMALLRAIGADRRHVLRTVMAEATLIATVSTGIGIALGLLGIGALGSAMTSLGLTFLEGPRVVDPAGIGIVVAIGMGVTLAAAWFPARRAAAAAPIEALRESSTEEVGQPRVRGTVGYAFVALGAGAGLAAALQGNAALLAVGGLLVPGLVLAGPSSVSRAVKLMRPSARRLMGIEGVIATTNLDRSARRASSTTLALTLGVALVGFFSVLGSSLAASLGNNLDDALRADHVITSLTPNFSTIDPSLAGRVRAIDGVETVAALRQTTASIEGSPSRLAGVTADDFEPVFDVGLLAGNFDAISNGGIAVVADSEDGAPRVGEKLTVESGAGTFTLDVVAVIDNSTGGFSAPTHFVSTETFNAIAPNLPDTAAFVGLIDDRAEEELRSVVAASPGSLLADRNTYVVDAGSEVRQILNLVYSMLGLTVGIAVIGVANTTALAVSERTREIGLLRAIGTTASGVRRIIHIEAMLMSLIGTTTGLILAIGGASALINAAGDTELSSLAISWRAIIVICVGGTVGGLGAASLPAWAATRRPTLDALCGC